LVLGCRPYYSEPWYLAVNRVTRIFASPRNALRLRETGNRVTDWHFPGVTLLATLLLSVGEHYYFTNVSVVDG